MRKVHIKDLTPVQPSRDKDYGKDPEWIKVIDGVEKGRKGKLIFVRQKPPPEAVVSFEDESQAVLDLRLIANMHFE